MDVDANVNVSAVADATVDVADVQITQTTVGDFVETTEITDVAAGFGF